MYVHRKIKFVTVNQNTLNYGGGIIVFYRSVVKACFFSSNPHCPILKTALHRLQLRIMSGPASISPVRPDGNVHVWCSSTVYSFKTDTILHLENGLILLKMDWWYFAMCHQLVMLIQFHFHLPFLRIFFAVILFKF